MKNPNIKPALIILLIATMLSNGLFAQSDKKSKRPSPPATATGKIGNATITIDYSSPSVKGRKIFGGLLPYGTLWRAGANEATIFQTDQDITVEGKKLAAGKYSLFATPGEKEWSIFFNSETGQWGDKKGGKANMDPSKTVLTVTVTAKQAELHERLTYEISADGMTLSWENTAVKIGIHQ
jgi:Protein of unknown function (DUF2911)